MEDDIIQYQIQDFINIQDNIILDNDLEKYYNNFFNKYDCFTKPLINDNNHKKYNFKSRNYKEYERRFPKRPKDINKQTLEILNKINSRNYKKMLTKIRNIITENNVSSVINDILKQCTLQIAFKDVFLELLHDIYIHSTPSIKSIIKNNSNQFIDKYLLDKDFVIFNKTQNNDCSYDDFCMQQKKKATILSKNIINLELIRISLVSQSLSGYTQFFVSQLNHMLDDNDSDYYLDIIINIFQKIKENNNIDILMINYDKLRTKSKNNQKLKFMIMDFMNII